MQPSCMGLVHVRVVVRRYLSSAETLAYLAWGEAAVDHPSVLIALLDDCLLELPKMQVRAVDMCCDA